MRNKHKKIRVLILVDHALGISGPHRNVVGTLNSLTAREDISVLLYTGKIDRSETYARSKNIKIIEAYPDQLGKIISNLLKLLGAIGTYDIVYIPSGLKSLLYAQLLRLGRKLMAGPNVTPLPLHGKSHVTKLEVHWMCDHWIEASSALEKYVLQEGVKRERVSVVHHAIDLERFSPKKSNPMIWRKYGVSESSRKVIFVGRFDETRKGYHVLRAAWEKIQTEEVFDHWSLLLVGPGSVEFQNESNVPKCRALGKVIGDELTEIYASADVSVVPSSWEPFGFTVLESMASGLPVIGSNIAGINEQIDDQINGILVQLTNRERAEFLDDAPATLYHALSELLRDGDKRIRLGKAAREKAVSAFSEERLGNDLVSIMKKLLKI